MHRLLLLASLILAIGLGTAAFAQDRVTLTESDGAFRLDKPGSRVGPDAASEKFRAQFGRNDRSSILQSPIQLSPTAPATATGTLSGNATAPGSGRLPIGDTAPLFDVPMLGLSQSPQVDPDGPVLQKLLLQGRVAKTNEMYKNHLTFGIIGIQWRKLAYPTVLKVFNDTPAARAGIQPMDEIVAVDSIPLTGLEVNDVTGLIIDVPKSTVILSLRRKGQLSAAVMVRMDVDDIKDPLVRAAYGRTLQRRAGADEKEAPQF